jgi:Nuclease-related domain
MLFQLSLRGWWAGFAVGVLLVGSLSLLFFATALASGAGSRFFGGEAEQWTHDELTEVKREGWHVFPNVSFYDGDIDHVLVGVRGTFALETKWSAEEGRLRALARCSCDAGCTMRNGARRGCNPS